MIGCRIARSGLHSRRPAGVALGWAALARGTLEREIVVIVRHGSAHHFEGVNAPVDGGNTRLRTLPRYGHKEANRRACVYVGCGVAIILSMLTIAFDKLSGGILSSKIPRLIFYGEATGLVAFWRLLVYGKPRSSWSDNAKGTLLALSMIAQ